MPCLISFYFVFLETGTKILLKALLKWMIYCEINGFLLECFVVVPNIYDGKFINLFKLHCSKKYCVISFA